MWQALLIFPPASYACAKLRGSPGADLLFLLQSFSSLTKEDLRHVSLWQLCDTQMSHWQKAAAWLLSSWSDESAWFSAWIKSNVAGLRLKSPSCHSFHIEGLMLQCRQTFVPFLKRTNLRPKLSSFSSMQKFPTAVRIRCGIMRIMMICPYFKLMRRRACQRLCRVLVLLETLFYCIPQLYSCVWAM